MKLYAALLCILLVAPIAFASGHYATYCPDGQDCDVHVDEAIPDAVTGHTVYAYRLIEVDGSHGLGLPTDFAAVAGYFELRVNVTDAVQRECVVWFDGRNLDDRPGWGGPLFPGENAHPSDEDQAPNGDAAYQDYDFDRDVSHCAPRADEDQEVRRGSFAVAVEAGDCTPAEGIDYRFRGHLDFVDPNGVYHEVQEYDYACGGLAARGGPLGGVAGGGGLLPASRTFSRVVDDLFPTGSSPPDKAGCRVRETPVDNQDVANGDPGHVDVGHKCNGSLQDLFRERAWITRLHAPVKDDTLGAPYTFALQIDTCSGLNRYEFPGQDPDRTTSRAAGDLGAERPSDVYERQVVQAYGGSMAANATGGYPLFDVCTDGSSFSFDDTPRGRTVHKEAPTSVEDHMRGNGYGTDQNDPGYAKHRSNCRMTALEWPVNSHKPGPGDDDCYPEDHKTARIDLYVFDVDPTGGLWTVNTNHRTGPNAYVGPAQLTGPSGT